MPRFYVNYTVSPMQVQISGNFGGHWSEKDFREVAEKALNGWLNAGIKQWLGHTDASILVTYLDYQAGESWVKED